MTSECTWSSAFEWMGNENRMVTKCIVHPNAKPLIGYTWPSGLQLQQFEKTHDEELERDPHTEHRKEQGDTDGDRFAVEAEP